jgi:hypothetical protein
MRASNQVKKFVFNLFSAFQTTIAVFFHNEKSFFLRLVAYIIQRVIKLFANNARKFFLSTNQQNCFLVEKLSKVLPFPRRELFMFSILICLNLKCVIRNLFRSICIFVLWKFDYTSVKGLVEPKQELHTFRKSTH